MHRFDVVKAESVGGRPYMEDYSFASKFETNHTNRSYAFGVFDGHNGGSVARACNQFFSSKLLELTRTDGASSAGLAGAVASSFAYLDAVMAGRFPVDCGATATVAIDYCVETPLINDRYLVAANAGDSRAIVLRDLLSTEAPTRIEQLTVDHRPSEPAEKDRILAAGGTITYGDCPRILGALNVSRTLGDWYLRPYTTAVPHLYVTRPLGKDDLLVLATDGIWDALDNREVASECANAFANHRRGRRQHQDQDQALHRAAEALHARSRAAGSTDNATVLLAAAATSIQ